MADFHLMQIRDKTRDPVNGDTSLKIGCGTCADYTRVIKAESESLARTMARYEFSKHARGINAGY